MVEVRTNILTRLIEVLDPEYKTGMSAAKGFADVAATMGIAGAVAAASTAAGKGLVSEFAAIGPVSPTSLGTLVPNTPAVALAPREISQNQGQGMTRSLPPRT